MLAWELEFRQRKKPITEQSRRRDGIGCLEIRSRSRFGLLLWDPKYVVAIGATQASPTWFETTDSRRIRSRLLQED